ncbi:amidase [Heyndrickxia coagulans]|uniref:amidase n=1 Tax=Heyndrickxia coagulans TaxID=1398 RepID=UPI002235E792|nr:amidase [Heyndrickxia coagulans]UZH07966.1 amidase [Heyndrickxia coagulans]
MEQSAYLSYDATELARLIKRKEVSVEEVLEAAMARIEKTNRRLNAVIRTRFEKAKKEAAALRTDEQPFAGVPVLLKDISQAVKGELLTSGSKLLQQNRAREDAFFTAKLREAGFIILGQTNVPEFGLKNITEPELYGPARNPWNPHFSPGGSSGGSAAAVASGMVPVAGASDGGGSIRIPASFTSLTGLKPTRGRTPVGPGRGRQWQGAAIDFVLAKTVRDSAALLDVLQTVEPAAAFQTPLFPGYVQELKQSGTKKYRIAFSVASPVGTPVSRDEKQAVYKTAKWLEQEGHLVEEAENGVDGRRLMENYYLMNCGEMAAELSDLESALGRPLTEKDMEPVSWVLYAAGKNVTAAEYAKSLAEWDKAAAQMAGFHETYDLYLTPSTAFTAPKIGELTQTGKERDRLFGVTGLPKEKQQALVYEMFEPSLTFSPFTQLANLTGQPAISLPVHITAAGLPFGIQLVAPKGNEHWLLDVAYALEQSELWVGMQGNPCL